MTVKIRGNTVHVFLGARNSNAAEWKQAADIASHTRPFKRQFYAAADPDSVNPEYQSLLDEAEAIRYECTSLTLAEAKDFELKETFDFVTNDDEYDYDEGEVAFYHHQWTFTDGFPH